MTEIESIPVPAMRLDANGRVIEANASAGRLFRRDPRSLIGHFLEHLVPTPAPFRHGIVSVGSGQEMAVFSEKDLEAVFLRELFHLTRLSAMGQLVASIVHELNNALSGILGYSQLLLQRDLEPAIRRDLEQMFHEAQRISRVVESLLKLGRSQAHKKRLSLDALIRRCEELKRRSFSLKSITFELKSPKRLESIEGDEALLMQVFLNLFSNSEQSIHSCRDRGSIRCRIRRHKRGIIVDVIDDGPGVCAEHRARIFEPFFTTRLGSEGTGLGLPLCREILNQHGAQISHVPRNEPGACFRLRFPARLAFDSPPESALASLPAMVSRINGCRIVIIEDETSVREVIARAFGECGNHLVLFSRGDDALPYLRDEFVDLIISDLHRPGLSGIELYLRATALKPSLARRFLFVTGDTTQSQIQEFLRRYRIRYLPKPLLVNDLHRAAEAVLRDSAATTEFGAVQA